MRALVHEAGDQNTVTRASASEGALEVARYRRSLQSISSTVPSAPSSIAPVRLGPENTNAPAMNGLSAPSTGRNWRSRSEEHTSELQSLMRISYAAFCLHK